MSAPLPSAVDVLVVGGGVAGVALAYYLARDGAEVALVERAELNREASGTNAGSLHLQVAIHQYIAGADPAVEAERLTEETRVALEAARMWHGLEAELGGTLDLHITGGLMVAETPEQVALLHAKHAIERAAGLETQVLEGDALRTYAPYLSDRILAGTSCPSEGHVNPLLAVPLFARRALEAGATIHPHAGVEAITATGANGGPFHVVTAAGEVTARRVVVAAGAWSRELATYVGLPLPMRAMGLHVNVTEPRERLLEPLIQHIGRRLTLKQSANHTFIIGGGWPAREEAAPRRWSTTWDSMAGNADVAISVVPALADVRVVRTWSGVMPWTDDVSPIVGESSRVPGFYALVVGSSGYTLSPLLARRLAAQMTDPDASATLPSAFSPDRAPASTPAQP